jgi:hypothetical protein
MPKRAIARIFLFATSVCVAQAQIPTGSLNGLVTDPKDAVIVGAHVTAVSAAQGFSRDTLTDRSGLYVLPDLPAGDYSLRIEQAGFAASEVNRARSGTHHHRGREVADRGRRRHGGSERRRG